MKALLSLLLIYVPLSLSADDNIINQSSSTNQIDNTDNTTMTVITMNIAHGRKDKFHQAFLGEKKIKNNLDHIVMISNRENPFLIALQEADGPSFWSGRFNHVEYISGRTGLKNHFQGYIHGDDCHSSKIYLIS